MMPSSDAMIQSLRSAGMRITPQRIAICQYLCESHAHPTAAMVYQALLPRFPSMSLATVYNTLDTLARASLISVAGSAGDNNLHYDADTAPHIHLACLNCHRITDFATADLDDIQHKITASGFKVIGAKVSVYGLCPDCQPIQPS